MVLSGKNHCEIARFKKNLVQMSNPSAETVNFRPELLMMYRPFQIKLLFKHPVKVIKFS